MRQVVRSSGLTILVRCGDAATTRRTREPRTEVSTTARASDERRQRETPWRPRRSLEPHLALPRPSRPRPLTRAPDARASQASVRFRAPVDRRSRSTGHSATVDRRLDGALALLGRRHFAHELSGHSPGHKRIACAPVSQLATAEASTIARGSSLRSRTVNRARDPRGAMPCSNVSCNPSPSAAP